MPVTPTSGSPSFYPMPEEPLLSKDQQPFELKASNTILERLKGNDINPKDLEKLKEFLKEARVKIQSQLEQLSLHLPPDPSIVKQISTLNYALKTVNSILENLDKNPPDIDTASKIYEEFLTGDKFPTPIHPIRPE